MVTNRGTHSVMAEGSGKAGVTGGQVFDVACETGLVTFWESLGGIRILT
jgi:hypothetical protein